MDWNAVFGLANMAVLPGWAILILGPRSRPWLMAIPGVVLPLALAVLYAGLILGYFFGVEDGGFNSVSQVRALFAVDPVLVGGWVHYLAFDLFVGTWLARHMDGAAISRLIQAPILALTFLFGPIGLLLGMATIAGARHLTTLPQEA